MTSAPNPILPGCYPDPSICRVGEWFYLVHSTFEYLPGLPVHRSRDLLSWEPIGHVLDRPGQVDLTAVPGSGGMYAPTIRHHDGRFWVLCTLVHPDATTPTGHFLTTASDPAGPWSDPVWLEGEGIDPSILFTSDGRAWVHATRLAAEPAWHDQTEVWVRELDLGSLELRGPETVIWTGALIGGVWAEAPHLYEIDGGVVLVAAEGGTDVHHAVMVARAEQVLGPYTGNPANPVLTHRQLGRTAEVVGVGHADLVQAPDGSWWAVLLAMRPSGGYHYPLGRETFLVPVSWEEGWPIFAPGLGRVPQTVEVPFAAAWRPGVTQGRTSGPVPPEDPRWTAVRALPQQVARVVPAARLPHQAGVADDGAASVWELALRPEGLGQVAVPAFLGVRLQHRDVDVTVTLSAPLATGEEVALAVRQSERDHVRLAVGAVVAGADGVERAVRLVHVAGGREREVGALVLVAGVAGVAKGAEALGEAEAASEFAEEAAVRLMLRSRGDTLEFFAGLGDAAPVLVGRADARSLDSVSTGGFLGLWVGVEATSNGSPTASVVRIEEFDYSPR